MTYRRMAADEWADDFVRRLEHSASRQRRLRFERIVPPPEVVAARDFEDKTEHLTRWLRAQNERKAS